MRKQHNYVKLTLLQQVWKHIHPCSVLDLCCGRGGDINKFVDLGGIDIYYIGFDVAADAIQEARRRSRERRMPNACFSTVNLNDAWCTNVVDLVSMQFALHYFCKDEATLTSLLRKISDHLHSGGMFVGTTTNFICTDFGQGITFNLPGCVHYVPEYKVPWHHVVRIAAQFKLAVCHHESFVSVLHRNHIAIDNARLTSTYSSFAFLKI